MPSSSLPVWAILRRAAIKYVDTGGAGRPLLLLHEMGGTLDSWEPVVALLPQTRRIVRCDMRGAGGSEKIRAAVTIDELVDDIVDLLDHLGIEEPVDVAGIAIGGCMTLRLAARYPHRVGRIVPINPPTNAHGRAGEVLRQRADICDREGMRGVVDAALQRSWPDVIRDDPRSYDAYAARFLCNDPTSYAHILRALIRVDFDGLFDRIRCPTVVVAGRHDLIRLPSDTDDVAKAVAGAIFLEIDGGHIPSVQSPEAVANVLLQHLFAKADGAESRNVSDAGLLR